MRNLVSTFGLLVILLAPFGQADATSLIPPRDLAELGAASDGVVFARALESEVLRGVQMPYTHTTFVVERALSPGFRFGDRVELQVPGGTIDGVEWIIPGTPRFQPGERYLLFLYAKTDDLWITSTFAYGILQEVSLPSGASVLAPLAEATDVEAVPRLDGSSVEPVVPYQTAPLLAHLADVLAERADWSAASVRTLPGEQAELDALQAEPDGGGGAVPGGCFYFNSDGRNWRQPAFDSLGSLKVYGNNPGDPSIRDGGFHLVQEGLDLWMNVSRTGCNLLFGGARDITPNCGGHSNFILFDDPCSDIADLQGCGGVLAFGGGSGGGTHRFDGTTWISMVNWFVVMNNGVGCLGSGGYRILLAHELGHGLGFGHSQDSGALMWGNCCRNINGTDRTCVRYTYPSPDTANERPVPDAGPDRTLRLASETALLSGSVSDDGLPAGGTVTTTWRFLAGPAPVVFGDVSAVVTTVTFAESGRYLLGLIADDGQLMRQDQVFLDVEITGRAPPVVFAQGVDGYTGTVDTMLVEASPGSNRAAATELAVDGDDPGGSGQSTQALLRFDDIFGTGPGQVLPGAAIRAARLELTTTNAGSGATVYPMRDTWADTARWTTFGGDGVQSGDEALAEREDLVSGAGSVVEVDVTESLRAWSRRPCSNHGWAFLPRGDDGWDFWSAEGEEPPRLVVEVAPLVGDPLIALGERWDFFKGTQAPPADWNQLDFTRGAGWSRGPTGIGYGDDDDATVLADMEGNYGSVFCRREFSTEGIVSGLRLRIDYDDGFVAFLNGAEVARSASIAPAGANVAWNALARGQREAGAFEEYPIDPALLVAGTNVLAIQVHNTTLDSSDLSLLPELLADHTVLPGGAEWSFLRGSAALPANWTEPDFDDSGWEVGRTGIGYGDGDDLTNLDDMEGSYLTVFCRKELTIPELGAGVELLLRVVYDDGVVVFVNGVEVDRLNVGGGIVRTNLAASSAIDPTVATIPIPSDLLVEGTNVLAVSVHNAALDSSDLSFDPLIFPFSRAGCGVEFKRSDASGDGAVNVSDAITILLYLFGGGADLTCPDAADIDDSGGINVTDPVRLLQYLFQSGEPPPAPGTSCGEDPTPDDLAECVTDSCADGP